MSDVTGNLVGLSGNVLYKFEALVGGIFLVFSAFKLTPDFSVLLAPGPIPEARVRGVASPVRLQKDFCSPGSACTPSLPGAAPPLHFKPYL